MEIYIDFDGTISPVHYPDELTLPPSHECLSTIRRLKEEGHTIVIWSCRANPGLFSKELSDESTREMIDYLHTWEVPYDRIDRDKPLYSVLICDRAISCKDGDWKRISNEVYLHTEAKLPKWEN